MRGTSLICCVMLIAVPVSGQVYPGPGDARFQQIEHRAGSIIPLTIGYGYQLTLGFAPDERIESVAVGDSGSWQVTANKRGDYLFVKPIGPGMPTNLTVITDTDLYSFDLSVGEEGALTPYVVRVVASAPATPEPQVPPGPIREVTGRYRVGGARALRPKGISDNGRQTFIEWPADATLPAVYGISQGGEEVLTNGDMIDGRFVLDTVYDRLIFRLDTGVARAVRLKDRASQGPG